MLVMGLLFMLFPKATYYLNTFKLYIEKKEVQVKGLKPSKGEEIVYRIIGGVLLTLGILIVVSDLFA